MSNITLSSCEYLVYYSKRGALPEGSPTGARRGSSEGSSYVLFTQSCVGVMYVEHPWLHQNPFITFSQYALVKLAVTYTSRFTTLYEHVKRVVTL